LAERGYRRLHILVPFEAQATPAMDKWTEAGFTCDVQALAARTTDLPLSEWVSGLVRDSGAEALVLDYVGFPSSTLGEVTARLEIPVFDLGHLAFDATEEILGAL
ncbi:MAG: hypothetical protein ACR2QM_06000, partial [Longimicrobiales bacterium]